MRAAGADEAAFREACGRGVAAILPVACAVLGALEVAYGLAHVLILPPEWSRVLAPLGVLSGAALLGLFAWLRWRSVAPARAHAVATAAVTLLVLDALAHLGVSRDPLQTTNVLLIMVGVALVFLSWPWFALAEGLCVVGWGAVAATLPRQPALGHFAFAILSTAVLAVILHHQRLGAARRAQALLAESEERGQQLRQALFASDEERSWMRAVLDALPAGLYVVDRQMRVRAWNRPREQGPLGVAHEAAIDRDLRDILSGAEGERTVASLRRVFETGREQVETLAPGFQVFEARRVPLLRDGQVTHVLSWFEDVTASRRADEALRESEGRFRTLFEHSPLPMFVYEAGSLRLLAANEELVRLYGYAPDELLSMRVTDLRDPAVRQGPPPSWLEAAGGASVQPAIDRHRARDGRALEVVVVARPIEMEWRDAHLAVVRDVTAERLLEAQVRQGQKMEAVGRLAGGIAHDFNNLITVVMGFAEMLRRGTAEDDPRRKEVQEIVRAAERAGDLSRQLLTLSRKQPSSPQPVDLREVLSRAERLLRRALGEDVELRCLWQGDVGVVRADPGQLEQVFMNLAVNSRDAMPQGGRLTISLDRGEPGEGAEEPGREAPVRITVTDTGVGMDEETQSRMFDPFFTTKEPGKGTGLGLATVYGIVTQLGGSVSVRSRPGQGTTFTILLPPAEGEAAGSRARPSSLPGGWETVLVAEDDAPVRRILAGTLRGLGYRVLEASRGLEAVDLCAAEGPVHLLLADVVMPQMSGRELADEVLAAGGQTRVLFVSGHAPEVVERMGGLRPGEIILEKPVSPQDLARAVRRALDGAPAAPAAAAPGPLGEPR